MSNKPEASSPVHGRPGYLLKRIQQTLEHELNRRLRTLNLSVAQYAALEEHPGLLNADLAEFCFVTPQTMHQITAWLERQHWLERALHPEHGKIVQLTLTEAGLNLLRDVHRHVLEVEKKLTAELGVEKEAQLKTALGAFLNVLETPT